MEKICRLNALECRDCSCVGCKTCTFNEPEDVVIKKCIEVDKWLIRIKEQYEDAFVRV